MHRAPLFTRCACIAPGAMRSHGAPSDKMVARCTRQQPHCPPLGRRPGGSVAFDVAAPLRKRLATVRGPHKTQPPRQTQTTWHPHPRRRPRTAPLPLLRRPPPPPLSPSPSDSRRSLACRSHLARQHWWRPNCCCRLPAAPAQLRPRRRWRLSLHASLAAPWPYPLLPSGLSR
jgi:hypothetical protein